LYHKIKQKLFDFGLTKREFNLLFILLLILLLGLSIKVFKKNYPDYKNFDYTEVDSLFSLHHNNFDTTDIYFLNKPDSLIVKELDKRKKMPKKSLVLSNTKININKATGQELQMLPGVGPKLADLIISYRNKVGCFKSLEELKNVKGIGEKKFEKIKNLISLE